MTMGKMPNSMGNPQTVIKTKCVDTVVHSIPMGRKIAQQPKVSVTNVKKLNTILLFAAAQAEKNKGYAK